MEYAILIYRDEAETGVDWPKREADYLSYFAANHTEHAYLTRRKDEFTSQVTP